MFNQRRVVKLLCFAACKMSARPVGEGAKREITLKAYTLLRSTRTYGAYVRVSENAPVRTARLYGATLANASAYRRLIRSSNT